MGTLVDRDEAGTRSCLGADFRSVTILATNKAADNVALTDSDIL